MTTKLIPSTQISGIMQILLAVVFAGLLSIPFLNHEQYYFAWFAFVPLLFAIENASLKRTYCIGLLAGILLFVLGTYWVYDYIITAKKLSASHSLLLASVGWFYSAQVIALVLVVYKWLRQSTSISEFILFPVLVSAGTAAFPMLFAIRLGESQVNFHSALQAIEFVGVHGLNAVIALSNILLFRFLYNLYAQDSSMRVQTKTSWGIAVGIIAIWFLYGVISYATWNTKIEDWDTITIGLVQPNEEPWLKTLINYPEYSTAYPPELEMSKRLSEGGADLIVWPEGQPKNYLNNSNVKTAYSQSIQEFETSIIFQDTRSVVNGKTQQEFNTAVMLNANGNEIATYTKIKRIPIGEYIPFAGQSELVRSIAPAIVGDSSKELEKGKQFQIFKHPLLNLLPLICYETTFPDFVSQALNQTFSMADKSKGTMIVALSNDGWFTSLVQSKQHIYASSLRAVENRVPLVHAVNNGPSIVVMPNGRRIFTSNYQQAGGYLVDVPIDKSLSGSFYSKHPRLFLYLLYLSVLIFVVLAVWGKVKAKD